MAAEHAAPEFDLRGKLNILWRRKSAILLCVLLVTALSMGYSFTRTPRYASVAKVLLKPRGTSELFGQQLQLQSASVGASVDTEIEVITTEPIVERVRSKIGIVGTVRARQIGQTDLIAIRGESTDPAQAAVVANAYANSYVEFRRTQVIDELFAGSQEIQNKVAELQGQIDDLGKQIDAAPACADVRTTPVQCQQRTNIEQTVGLRRTALLNQQGLFRERLDQLQVDQALTTGGAALIAAAYPATVPFEPRHGRTAALGLMLGLALGLGLAFLFDHLDDSIKVKEDYERAVPTVPVLGLIPAVTDWRAKEETRLASITAPNSSVAEAYWTLRTSIQFLGIDREVKALQITSTNAHEGKTTTLANLAVAFARSGLRVLAVDCDLRRPRLHKFFGLENEIGFTSVLLETATLSQAIQQAQRVMVLASGPLPPNPSELLASHRTSALLERLSTQCDIVLIDSPPVLAVTDALVLSQRVDATIMVVLAGATTRRAAARSAEMLSQVNAPVVGAVLNVVRADAGYGGYKYEYSGTQGDQPATAATAPGAAVNGNGSAKLGRRRSGSGTPT